MILRITMVCVMLLIAVFGLFEWAQSAGHSVDNARTVAANVIVFGEMAFLFNCRSLKRPSWKMSLRTNPFLVGGVAVMIGLQMLFTYLPGMNHVFSTAPIAGTTWLWLWIIGVAVGVHVVMEIEKWIHGLRERRQGVSEVC